MDFVVPTEHRVKIKESKILSITWNLPESLKVVVHEGEEDSWGIWKGPRFRKGTK